MEEKEREAQRETVTETATDTKTERQSERFEGIASIVVYKHDRCEVPSHTASAVRKQRETNAESQLAFSFCL